MRDRSRTVAVSKVARHEPATGRLVVEAVALLTRGVRDLELKVSHVRVPHEDHTEITGHGMEEAPIHSTLNFFNELKQAQVIFGDSSLFSNTNQPIS